MLKEIKREKNYLQNQRIDTIYFGGGTPSLLTNEELDLILDKISLEYNIGKNPEVTLEANPDDITAQKLQSWKSLGITRLSIGLQSFIQSDLDWMNRAHTAEESYTAVQLARSYDFDLTIDLIYGLPKSNLDLLKTNIDKAIALSPAHISAYCLTIEPKTALNSWVDKGKIDVPSTDEQADQFSFLVNHLKSSGYEQYEISNFAKHNNYSQHNSNYWRGVHYLGIGPSAHSFNGVSRRWNVSNNKGYIEGINEGKTHFESEELSATDQFNELIMTGLRTKWGVDLERLIKIRNLTTEFNKTLDHYIGLDLIKRERNQIKLTDKGRLQADQVAAMLFI